MTRPIGLPALFALLALPLTACTEDAEGADEGANAERVTYYRDILPVLAENCNTCHTEGAVAPFALDDYDSAAQFAPLVAVAVQERTMPPFGANNDGSCNTFVDAQWLTDEEIDLITQWVDDGAPEGDPDTPRPEIRTPNELRGNKIVEIGVPPGYAPIPEEYPGGETEDYQCFLATEPATEEQFLIGFDVVPDNTELVHHVLAFEVNPSALGNGATMAALDADSPDQPGWKCTGAAGDGVIPEGVPVAWAPGTGAVNFPDGTGIKIDRGNVLVIQMHYDLSGGKTGIDSTIVDLDFADAVEREARQTLSDPFLYGAVLGNPDQLPPGQEHAKYEWSMTIADATFESAAQGDVEIYGLLPHMHKRGNSMTVEFGSDDGMQCGANIDRWDFDWQRLYFLETPLLANYQDEIRVVCDYDTSRDAAPILPGFGTEDEMCLVGLYIVPK
jgi:hypothetical protein